VAAGANRGGGPGQKNCARYFLPSLMNASALLLFIGITSWFCFES
jgi:hypothetical protein